MRSGARSTEQSVTRHHVNVFHSMAESAEEEIEELPEEDGGAEEVDLAPPSETTEAKKRAASRLHADVAKICENEGDFL